MKIEVSNGEIIDKWTILQIKSKRIKDKEKLLNVKIEMEALEGPMRTIYEETHQSKTSPFDLGMKQDRLFTINDELWDVEDSLRELERMEFWNDKDELDDFVDLARQVYHLNDQRARVKREINELTGSALVEEKSYEEY